ncbi:hypothetical protein IWQ61_001241 [Dispira simplex]|nr:hypothetical protein IWQ61_001241 [Dispira simplex]
MGLFSHSNSSSRSRLTRMIWSYAADWVLVIIMALGFFAIDKIHPFQRQFSLDDKTIQYPHKPDTVSPAMLIGISFGIPILVVFFVAIFIRRSWFDLHQGWLGLMLGLTLTIMITHTLKITAGRLRPDFISRCKLDLSDGIPKDPELGLSTMQLCTQTNEKLLRDGMKSFPSGHSSLSFAGLFYVSLFLAGKLHIHDRKGHTIKSFMVILPILGAAWVAVSRTVDYRHHWQDVVVGSLIGIACAYFAYRQYYPSLYSHLCHRPYSPRIPSDINGSTVTAVETPQYPINPDDPVYPFPTNHHNLANGQHKFTPQSRSSEDGNSLNDFGQQCGSRSAYPNNGAVSSSHPGNYHGSALIANSGSLGLPPRPSYQSQNRRSWSSEAELLPDQGHHHPLQDMRLP